MTTPKAKLVGLALITALCGGFTLGCLPLRVVNLFDVAVSRDRLANIKKIAVVAMEPPPRILPHDISLAKLPPGSVRADQTWLPTVVVANEIAHRLERESNLIITLKKEIASFPGGVDRRQTFFMEGWYAPIRAWYTSGRSSFNYSNMASDGVDAVLEVGISNYEFVFDRFVLQINLKFVDAKSGEVIGKAREYAMPSVGPTSKLFTNEGRPFKKMVADLINQLVPQALRNIGLLK